MTSALTGVLNRHGISGDSRTFVGDQSYDQIPLTRAADAAFVYVEQSEGNRTWRFYVGDNADGAASCGNISSTLAQCSTEQASNGATIVQEVTASRWNTSIGAWQLLELSSATPSDLQHVRLEVDWTIYQGDRKASISEQVVDPSSLSSAQALLTSEGDWSAILSEAEFTL